MEFDSIHPIVRSLKAKAQIISDETERCEEARLRRRGSNGKNLKVNSLFWKLEGAFRLNETKTKNLRKLVVLMVVLTLSYLLINGKFFAPCLDQYGFISFHSFNSHFTSRLWTKDVSTKSMNKG